MKGSRRIPKLDREKLELNASLLKKTVKFAWKYVCALLGSVYLFTLGLLFRRNRDLLTTIALHFGYGPKREKEVVPLIPEIEWKELFDETPSIRLLEMDYARGNVSLHELAILNQWVKAKAPRKIFEMGTFDGRTTLNLSANSPEDSVIFTIDLPKGQMLSARFELEEREKEMIQKEAAGLRYSGRAEAGKIVQLYGDTASFDFGPYFGTMDFVFVDASHAHAYVLNDSRIALKLLKGGKGMILWHDYAAWNGVTSALNELYEREPAFRPARRLFGTHLVALVRD